MISASTFSPHLATNTIALPETASLSDLKSAISSERQSYGRVNDFDSYRQFVGTLFTKYPEESSWPFILECFPKVFTHNFYDGYSESKGYKKAFTKLDFNKPSYIRQGQEATPEEVQVFVERLAKICMAIAANPDMYDIEVEGLAYQSFCDTNTFHHLLDYLIQKCPPALFASFVENFAVHFRESQDLFASLLSQRLHKAENFPSNMLDYPPAMLTSIDNREMNTFEKLFWLGKLYNENEMRAIISAMQNNSADRMFPALFQWSYKAICLIKMCPAQFNPSEVLSFLASCPIPPKEKLTYLQSLFCNYSNAGVDAVGVLLSDSRLVESFKPLYTLQNCSTCIRDVTSFEYELLSQINPEIVVPLFVEVAKKRPSLVSLTALLVQVPPKYCDPALIILATDPEFVKKMRAEVEFSSTHFDSNGNGLITLNICKKLFPDWENMLINILEKFAVRWFNEKPEYKPDCLKILKRFVKALSKLEVLNPWVKKDLVMFSPEAKKALLETLPMILPTANL